MIKQNLSSYKKLFSNYTELRFQENRNMFISYINGTNTMSKKTVIKNANDNAIFLDKVPIS